MLRRELLRPDRPEEESVYAGDDAPDSGHWGAFVDEALVAVASIYPEPLPESVEQTGEDEAVSWRLRGMAVCPVFQGKGYGRQLLDRCLQAVADNGGNLLWCNARTSAVGFYQGMGFEIAGSEFMIPDIGPHYVMLRSVRD